MLQMSTTSAVLLHSSSSKRQQEAKALSVRGPGQRASLEDFTEALRSWALTIATETVVALSKVRSCCFGFLGS